MSTWTYDFMWFLLYVAAICIFFTVLCFVENALLWWARRPKRH